MKKKILVIISILFFVLSTCLFTACSCRNQGQISNQVSKEIEGSTSQGEGSITSEGSSSQGEGSISLDLGKIKL